MRVAFFGSGSPLSAAALREIARRHDVRIVIEHPRRLGRRDRLKRVVGLLALTPLAAVARRIGVNRVDYDRERAAAAVHSAGAELIVIASFPTILPERLLSFPGINLHQALLPRHRGADPLFWTYHANDLQAGTTVHWLTGAMDAGDIISQQAVPLPRGYPMPRLYEDLARSGSVQLADAIEAIESNTAQRLPQNPADVTQEPPPAKRTWRVEFDSWSAERTWHFLSGIGNTYGSLCRDPSGADMPLGGRAVYSQVQHAERPGRWERMRDGSVILYCPDGTVTSVP